MKLSLIDYEKFELRLYQELIAATASKKNTLCILPTGLGKTYVAILVAAYRLEQYPNSKTLMIAPTRPLVNQHMQTFKKIMTLDPSEFIALTGKVLPSDRKVLYSKGRLFFATPELIRNDISSGLLDLRDFSLLVVDECHRSVKKYAYTSVVDGYLNQSPFPLILGLTASPGGIKDKIDEVKRHLRIEAVEIRTEKDEDVKAYVKETEVEKVYVELPDYFKKIKDLLDEARKDRIERLVHAKLLQSTRTSKRELLEAQMELGKLYDKTKDPMVGRMMVHTAQAIRIEHAVDLLETQGIMPLYKYFLDLEKQKTSSTKQLLNDVRITAAIRQTKDLYVEGYEHPKLKKLIEIVKSEIERKKNVKIIVFANYRDTVEKITKMLQVEGIEAREFIGQAKKAGKGLSQKEQIQILNEFRYEMFNVLVGTSISEEGIDIPAVDAVIFYEPVPSEIRTIQRRGRTGRTEAGRAIFLITKDTRDEGYYWAAYHKEKRMRRIIEDIKEKRSLKDWII